MSEQLRVVITDFIEEPLVPEREVLGDLAQVEALGAFSEADMEGRVEDADALMVYHEVPITESLLVRMKKCRVISRCGVGYDNVDLEAARRCGIPVCNVPDYGTEDVADSAVSSAVAMVRGIFVLNSRQRAGLDGWSFTEAVPLERVRGAVLGIIGLGRIGTAAALRARSFGLDVLFYDPYKPDGCDKSLGIRRAEMLEELLAASHVVSIHTPLTPETHHMIRAETIALMPAGSYLVNTARGSVVRTADLPAALASGQLAGAAIDVLEVEPAREEDPLLVAWRDPAHPAHHRLVVTPHTAFYSDQSMVELRSKGAQVCRRALLGLPQRNVVNDM